MRMSSEDSTRLRYDLLSQLDLIIDELEATKYVGRRLSAAELESRQEKLSIKECYGTMADWDHFVVVPMLRRMQQESLPVCQISMPEVTRWNGKELVDILEAAQTERRALMSYLEKLPIVKWSRKGKLEGQIHDVFGLLHALVQHDVELLQSVARQLRRAV